MRKIFPGILLIGLLLVTMAAGAENTSDTGTLADNQDPSPTIRSYFAAVGIFGSMASEEAFEYVLTNDTTLKDEFYVEMNATEEAINAFEKAETLADEYEQVFRAGFEDVKAYVPKMKEAAEKMFTSFEETGKPVLEDAKDFEEAGDHIIHASDRIWNETAPGLLPPTPYTRERSLYDYLMRAIEESYAYPVTANITEKEHALANFAAIDTRIAIYESNAANESYEDFTLMKQDLMEATEKMFASYEKDGVVNRDDLQSLEILTEKINEGYRENNKKLSG
jgi:hypothetical protein